MSELSQILLGLAGGLLSLIFTYFPPAKKWYDEQSNKGLLMLAFIGIIGFVYFALGCVAFLAALLHIAVSCDAPGFLLLVQAIVAVAIGNQLVYLFNRNTRAG